MHEAQMQETNCFLTLTYDDEHLPPDGSLDVSHWQLFAKKLRKRLGKFRYFHCGEYGDLNKRPHYHAALLGLDFTKDRILWKHTKQGEALYTSPTLAKIWPEGLHAIGDLSFDSAAYVARYIMKKRTGSQAEQHYNGKHPEYCTMSRNPGIGKSWFEKWNTDVYPSDEVIINGAKCAPPKYYDQLYKLKDASGYARLKQQRADNGKAHQENNTPDRLEVREEFQAARIRELTREL